MNKLKTNQIFKNFTELVKNRANHIRDLDLQICHGTQSLVEEFHLILPYVIF